MSLIHRKPSQPKPELSLSAADPVRNLTPFGPDNPSPAPFLPGHSGMRTGRTQRSRADIIRKFLECTKVSAKDERGRTRLEQMVANLVEIAKSSKSPQAVAAFVALTDRAYGKPRTADEDLDVLARGGVRFVMVTPPADIPRMEERGEDAPLIPADFDENR